MAERVLGVRALPPGQTVADVAAGLSFIMSRHQSLRTRLRFGNDGQAQQVVHASGEIMLDVVDAGERDPGEVAAAVAAGRGLVLRSRSWKRPQHSSLRR